MMNVEKLDTASYEECVEFTICTIPFKVYIREREVRYAVLSFVDPATFKTVIFLIITLLFRDVPIVTIFERVLNTVANSTIHRDEVNNN